jgi:glycosyltransferase involved in cell wall biosynthesis
MNELLTICILTYNRPKYLLECINSILNQTFQNFRVVILDNASELNYSEVLNCYSDPRIIYRRHKTNMGAAGNMSLALNEYTDGKYSMFFHDDDLMHPQLLATGISILENNKDIVFVSSLFQAFKEIPTPFQKHSPITSIQYCNKSETIENFLKGMPVHFGSTIFRNESLKNKPLEYDKYSKICDRPFLLGLLENGKKCAIIKEPLVLYRLHDSQDSKIGELSGDNIIELYKTYRESYKFQQSIQNYWLYFSTTGYEMLDSYSHLSKENRDSLFVYLKRCKNAKVISYPFLLIYFSRKLRTELSKFIIRCKTNMKRLIKNQ